MCGRSMVVLSEQWMMVKNDDNHRKACIVSASEGRDRIKTSQNHAILERKKWGE